MMLNPICLQRKKEGLKIFGQGPSCFITYILLLGNIKK